jgi:hypothetical protein
MFSPSKLISSNLEFLVRTALSNGELSPGVFANVERYRRSAQLSAVEQRYLAILDDAINSGCIQLIEMPEFAVGSGQFNTTQISAA